MNRRSFLSQSALATGGIMIVPRFVLGGKGFIAPSDKINLGFIGTGKQSGGLGKRLRSLESIQMVAACDINQVNLQRFVKQTNEQYAEMKGYANYAGCTTYTDYQALVENPDLDAVIVATPDHWHAIISIAAMEAGKDVYCEKPLAHTIKEGRAMVRAADKYDRILQTGSMQRSGAGFRKAVNLVRSGYIGKVEKVLVNVGDPAKDYDLPAEPLPAGLDWDAWIGPAPMRPYNQVLSPQEGDKRWPMWRHYREFGGGILSDWGAHMFDIAQWGLDKDHTGPVKFIPPSDPSAVRGLKMIYEDGVEMIHEDFERGWAVRFIGSEGSLDVSRQFLDSNPKGIAEKTLSEAEQIVYHSENHYQDWIDCIKKRTQPICPPEVGHRSASVCNLANIAYQTGRTLEWDPVKEKFKGDGPANKLRTKKYRKPYKL